MGSWLKTFSFTELVAFSFAANVATFVAALLLGEAVRRLWRARPVANEPPPVTREELWLAAACVMLNTGVMIAGWLLFQRDIIRVIDSAPVWRWLTDAAVLLLVMDLAMYLTHRIAHHPLAYRLVHSLHHKYDHPRPLTLFVLHPLEVLGFGGLWLAVLIPHVFSIGGIFLYLAANTTFGTLGHVGVEPFPRALVQTPLGSSTFHADHHQQPTRNYGFYTSLWDRLFGTFQP